ncbi:GNAT family N-acetyltransferase [Paenibacillus sp. J23TS9]|uniref:GNAT family N-acetyltransferase n=1 Tax=Paenibacillus sp. J23TS9 TaxID=2807193 RepID=UPI001BCB4432|nr:GNAT family N-acetyltransferase [Paenibacillus sp. J23TS9]
MNERNEWLARKLVHADSDMMFAGVVAGNNPGQVWADNELNPSSAIVWSSGLGGFNFMGSAGNTYFNQSIETFIDHEIIPFLSNKNIHSFEFSVDTYDWFPTIYQAIGNRKIEESFQYVYKSSTNKNDYLYTDIPPSYMIAEIDDAFYRELNNGGIKNAEFLVNYIEQYWGTFNNYLGKGYGYAALTENKEIVSIAVSSFIFNSTHAIGVETQETYKRQGLSSSLVQLLLKKFNENNTTAWWDCMESNMASQKTAEKAGLFKAHRYKINWFNF